jgi:hypothetical protein
MIHVPLIEKKRKEKNQWWMEHVNPVKNHAHEMDARVKINISHKEILKSIKV